MGLPLKKGYRLTVSFVEKQDEIVWVTSFRSIGFLRREGLYLHIVKVRGLGLNLRVIVIGWW